MVNDFSTLCTSPALEKIKKNYVKRKEKQESNHVLFDFPNTKFPKRLYFIGAKVSKSDGPF